jgi:hypothetical protein
LAIIRVPHFKQVPTDDSVAPVTKPEGLDEFHTEAIVGKQRSSTLATPVLFDTKESEGKRSKRPALIALAIGVVGVLAAGAGLAVSSGWASKVFAGTPAMSTLSLQTSPVGALVSINGEARGATPLSLSLPAGAYQVKLLAPTGQERVIDVTLKAGESVVQQIEWAAAPAPVTPTTGALHVVTDPPGQVVFVDDARRGNSPLTVSDLSAGEHRLVVSSETGSYRRPITIVSGETLSVVVAPNTPAASGGWLRVTSPVLLQLRAGGDLIGNTETARVMLPPGEHEIEMSNDALGFSRTQRVTVSAGRTAEVRVTLPNGSLSINAVPWAEVFLNGERLGETPLANISRPIGTYRVTFRHPQLGERQATVTLSTKETTRLGIDMRQP